MKTPDATVFFEWVPAGWLTKVEDLLETHMNSILKVLTKPSDAYGLVDRPRYIWSFTIFSRRERVMIQMMVMPELLDEADRRLKFLKLKYPDWNIPGSVLVVSVKMPEPHLPKEVLLMYDLMEGIGADGIHSKLITQTILG